MQNIFGFIIHPMELGLIWLAIAVGSAGVGIILFTVAIRLILAPMNIIQLRSARAMQKLQPKIAELRKKHGKDREAISKATMELYKEHNVNPAMGCLPMLLQFPILIGLFYGLMHLGTSPSSNKAGKFVYNNVFCGPGNKVPIHNFHKWLDYCYKVGSQTGAPQHVYNLFHADFLWLSQGLGKHDPLFILPILAGLSQWVQSRMTLQKSTDQQQQMMNSMMNFLPLMIVFFAANYASGLSLYWVTSTLIGIAIQYKITGWGLLPDTLGGFAGRFGFGPAPATTRRSSPARSGQNNKQRALQEATASPEELEPNGSDGTDGGTAPGSAARRRRKGRARGGRSGRRG